MKLYSDYLDCEIDKVIVLAAPELSQVAKLVASRLRTIECEVTVLMMFDARAVDEAIKGEGCSPSAFIVIDDGTDAEHANRVLRKQEIPCLFVEIDPTQCRIGPWTYYEHTPCWQCSATTSKFFFGEPRSGIGSCRPVDCDNAAAIVDAFMDIVAGTSKLIDGLIFIDTPERRTERVLKDPLCPVCSVWVRQPTEAFYVEQD